ncbi:flagellar export chaperone FlgN [Tissierella sp.]|uniref:flagellar export chaperone FlgN n=1 Tax=Tissierella sp. TaxID=41274 RepID=UPI00285697A5|nr:flagellar export chaperone FlgN [Tissierella sp.]MDR7856878.1 flagellar export chaperone FlgN [Tissierella sp.]
MTVTNINKVILLSKDKKKLLTDLLKLTKKQKDLIDNDNLDDLGIVLEDKENIMNKVDIIDKDFLGLYNTIKSEEGIDSFDKIDVRKFDNVKTLKDIVEDVNNILNEISALDNENTRKMKSNIDKIKLDIKQVKEGKKAYKGYNYESSVSMLIDEKK